MIRPVLLLSLGLVSMLAAQPKRPPATRAGATIEDYHGTKVTDPYRWLEDADAPETLAWVTTQNQVTFDYLRALPGREALKRRLSEPLLSQEQGNNQ